MHLDVATDVRAAYAVLNSGADLSESGLDPRWQAIIAVGEFIASSPEEVWSFAQRRGCHAEEDVRDAIATLLVEHLLEHHFEEFFPRVAEAACADARFADTVLRCWKFGRSELPANSDKFDALQRRCSTVRGRTAP